MGSRTDPETRQASLLLSGLVLTPDNALEAFRERRAADKELDIEHLKRARDLLDYLSHAISSADGERWQRIEQAWNLVQQKEVPAPRESSPVAPAPRESAPVVPAPRDSAPASPPISSPSPPAVVPRMRADKGSPWAPPPPPRRPPPPRPRPPELEPTEALDIDGMKRARDEQLEGTMPVDATVKRSGLPFKPGAAAPPAPIATEETESDVLGKTAYLDPNAAHDVQTLPFHSKLSDSEEITTLHSPGAPPAPPSSSPASASILELEPDPSSSFEPTERLDVRAHAPPADLPDHLRALTLEQHAALSAECSVFPEWREQIHARYGVQKGDRDALDRHFQKKMDGDPALAEQWRWHYQRYEAWARQRRG